MPTVVSLGVHILDVLGRPVSRIPPKQDIDLLDEIRLTVAGTAAGTSIDLAKLGVAVRAMGALGGDADGNFDAAGNFVRDTMRRYGIDTSGLVVKSGVQTSATMLPIRPNGERPALHVLGANAHLSFDDIDLDAIAEADILHFGGSPLMPMLDGAPARRVLQHAKAHGTLVTMDILAVDRPDLPDLIVPLLPFVDYFMPGLDEARLICGLHDRSAVIRHFLDRGAAHVVFKMGDQGSIIAGKTVEGEIRIPAFAADVVDSTGCGDAYCAGFITGLLHGWDLVRCGRLGAACGALVITGLGSDAGITDLPHTIAYLETAKPLPIID